MGAFIVVLLHLSHDAVPASIQRMTARCLASRRRCLQGNKILCRIAYLIPSGAHQSVFFSTQCITDRCLASKRRGTRGMKSL